MNTFFETIPLALTPLTPIHVGCGQDFEPTNYIIDDDVLYNFDPARVELSKSDREALLAAVNQRGDEAIRNVQRFFHARKERFAGVAHNAVSVASGVSDQYERRVGQVAQHEHTGSRVTNLLEIERTAHHPHSGVPFLPGTSIKGAIRTAWLDALNQGRGNDGKERAQDIEKRLLDSRSGFHTDPFRLLSVADASGSLVQSKVVFSTNHKKRLVYDRDGHVVDAKGPSTRRETILGGQYRALAGEIRFATLPGINAEGRVPARDRRIPGFTELAQACNRYYLKRLQSLIAVLDSRRFAEPEWLAQLQTLLSALRPELDAGHMMLLRVGRHSGAESVTLDGIRSIRIMKGRGQQPDWSPEGAKTVWLAADRDDARTGMQPFGWLILEPSGAKPIAALESWCTAQPRTCLAEIRGRLSEARERALAESDRQRQLEQQRIVAERDEAMKLAAHAAALATLGPEARQIAEFSKRCEDKHAQGRKDPLNPGTGLYADALRLSKSAFAEDAGWLATDRAALAAALEQWLPKVIEKLDRKDEWKDARKRLKIAALRGE